jgi:hypothetical protein
VATSPPASDPSAQQKRVPPNLDGTPHQVTAVLVEGIDLSRLVAGDFHADADFLNDGGRPLHGVSPGLGWMVTTDVPRDADPLVEGIDFCRLVARDFHADADFLNDGG